MTAITRSGTGTRDPYNSIFVPLDLTSAILPGISAAGIPLGQSVQNLPAPIAIELRGDFMWQDFGDVQIWIEGGRVQQIGVCGSYQGRLPNGIGLGCTIAQVEMAFGVEVLEDEEDNLIVTGSPGLCFDTQEWVGDRTLSHNRNALLTEIYVYTSK